MRSIKIKLPRVIRLALSFVRRRRAYYANADTPGNKQSNTISLFLRALFEHINIKKILGTNLALLVITTSLVHKTSAYADAEIPNPILYAPLILTTKAGVGYPVKKVVITQGYRFYHKGLDLDGITGDSIFPITVGRVETISRSRFGYGNSILINHGNNIKSLYAHLSKITVTPGQEVFIDTKLGEMGATGRASGDHLHLEIYENGKTINPLLILQTQ